MEKSNAIPIIKFVKNYNNKLLCQSFSTIRLRDDSKYELFSVYDIIEKRSVQHLSIKHGLARLQSIYHFKLDQLTDSMAYLDANMSKKDLRKVIRQLYFHYPINYRSTYFSLLVLQYLSREETSQVLKAHFGPL